MDKGFLGATGRKNYDHIGFRLFNFYCRRQRRAALMEFNINDLIGAYGFPIAVTAFLLWERLTERKQLQQTIQDMRDAVIELISVYKGGGK
jgi:hypothetical protein